jgi:hypothetical protein
MNMVLSALNFTFFDLKNDSRYLMFDESAIDALQDDLGDKIERAERLWKMPGVAQKCTTGTALPIPESWQLKDQNAMECMCGRMPTSLKS